MNSTDHQAQHFAYEVTKLRPSGDNSGGVADAQVDPNSDQNTQRSALLRLRFCKMGASR
jgi:hypothetical protein